LDTDVRQNPGNLMSAEAEGNFGRHALAAMRNLRAR
jgi:hypothetical protein